MTEKGTRQCGLQPQLLRAGILMNDDIVLSARNLRFLDMISYPPLDIVRGSFTFVCGRSGCGKSTLLRLFNATVLPSSGKIFCDGTDISDFDTLELRRRVLLVSQQPFLFDTTVRENFALYAESRGESCPDDEHISFFLSLACAVQSPDDDCRVLSGGERQRVFLAVCLSFEASVFMLDEPTSALDEATSVRLLSGLREYCRSHGTTVIIVSHDKSLAARFADDIIVLGEADNESDN